MHINAGEEVHFAPMGRLHVGLVAKRLRRHFMLLEPLWLVGMASAMLAGTRAAAAFLVRPALPEISEFVIPGALR